VSRFSQTPYAYRHLASRNTSFRSVDRNLMFRIFAGGPHLYSMLLRDPLLTVTSNTDRKRIQPQAMLMALFRKQGTRDKIMDAGFRNVDGIIELEKWGKRTRYDGSG